jgi:hypothetical protein
VVQSGQGADEIFAGYSWYPPLAGVPREQAVDAYAREFFDRPHADLARQLSPEWLIDSDVSREFVAASFGRPGATTAVDAALRLDSQVMLVDDPVKRVDNMTMAWGLEARVPFLDHELVELAAACPPELKLAQGGKGVLKDAARGAVPDEVIDRTKGYFPVPAIRHLEGPMLERGAEALYAPPARARGCSARNTLTRSWRTRILLAPRSVRTSCGSSRCWRCGCRTRGSSVWVVSSTVSTPPSCRRKPGSLAPEISGCWSPALSPDGRHAAYVSDRSGAPRVWVQPVGSELAFLVDTGEHPVASVQWFHRRRLAGLPAAPPGGAPRHELWLVRPDGSALHHVAGFGADTADNVRWLPGRPLLRSPRTSPART